MLDVLWLYGIIDYKNICAQIPRFGFEFWRCVLVDTPQLSIHFKCFCCTNKSF
jgi:hypothetical protein